MHAVSMVGTRVGGSYCGRCRLLEWQPLHQFGEVAGLYRVMVHWGKGWERTKTLLMATMRMEKEMDLTIGSPDVKNGGSEVIMATGP